MGLIRDSYRSISLTVMKFVRRFCILFAAPGGLGIHRSITRAEFYRHYFDPPVCGLIFFILGGCWFVRIVEMSSLHGSKGFENFVVVVSWSVIENLSVKGAPAIKFGLKPYCGESGIACRLDPVL